MLRTGDRPLFPEFQSERHWRRVGNPDRSALMKPQLKAQDCTDHDPIEAWQPADPAQVNYWLCLHIGPADQRGAELFYVNGLSGPAARQLDAGEPARPHLRAAHCAEP